MLLEYCANLFLGVGETTSTSCFQMSRLSPFQLFIVWITNDIFSKALRTEPWLLHYGHSHCHKNINSTRGDTVFPRASLTAQPRSRLATGVAVPIGLE